MFIKSDMKMILTKKFPLLLLFILLTLWNLGLSAPYFFKDSAFVVSIIPFLNLLYDGVCHQVPEKSFGDGVSGFLVCARCTGIYIGLQLTLMFLLFVSFRKTITGIETFTKYFLPFTFGLIIADVVSVKTELYHYTRLLSVTTGVLFGSAIIITLYYRILNKYHNTL